MLTSSIQQLYKNGKKYGLDEYAHIYALCPVKRHFCKVKQIFRDDGIIFSYLVKK